MDSLVSFEEWRETVGESVLPPPKGGPPPKRKPGQRRPPMPLPYPGSAADLEKKAQEKRTADQKARERRGSVRSGYAPH